MCDDDKRIYEGYRPQKKGYQPTEGNLDTSNPPNGGSGVPAKVQSNNGQDSNKK